MKRLFAALLTLILLVGTLGVFAVPVSAVGKETILIAGSDFQVKGHDTGKVEQLINTLAAYGITKAERAFFCGDYTMNSVDENQNQSTVGLWTLKRVFAPIVSNRMTFVQGNHDPADTDGLSPGGNNDPASLAYGVYVIHEDQYLQYNWDYSLDITKKTAANLQEYLDAKVQAGWNKPIFVLSHVGLHWGNRTIKEGSGIYAKYLVDVLNEAAQKGLNIIYLFGHDHSGGYTDYLGAGSIYFKKGDQLEICTGEKKGHEPRTIHFTYMNAGYIGYYSTTTPDADATVTMSVFRIQEDGSVIITRYDHQGIHNLKSKGAYSQEFFKKYGYHVDINTLEYASSRRVTATDDVPVDPPVSVPTESTTVTTMEWNSNKSSSKVFHKQTDTTTASTASITDVAAVPDASRTTAVEKTTSTTDAAEMAGSTDGDATTTAENATLTENDAIQASSQTDMNVTQDTEAGGNAASQPLFPWWAWLIIGGGAVFLIGAVMMVILMFKSDH